MTLPAIDFTHDRHRVSWIASANGHPDFPLQNLPLGMFRGPDGQARGAVAIGDSVVDLAALAGTGLLGDVADVVQAAQRTPNGLVALAPRDRQALRVALFELLDARGTQADAARSRAAEFLRPMEACRMELPARIGSYTDFNAGIHHSARGGMRRGRSMADALLPNYRHVPIGYHGRSSSVRPSGTDVRRPWGQSLPAPGEPPVFTPSRKLDFELELAIWLQGETTLGEPLPIARAAQHIAGFGLLNDWSARDLQSWESERLGPFLGKSFGTTVSPWIVTPEAMAPFRAPAFPRADGDPRPLPYLLDDEDQAHGGLELALEVWLQPAGEPTAVRISRSHARHLYWTPAQMVAHQASNGCNLAPGDLLGTGTVSGPEADAFGTLLDAISPRTPVLRAGKSERVFLHDGDAIILKAHARRDGFVSIGFGECRAAILPAVPAFA